jgi:hypothetical protein
MVFRTSMTYRGEAEKQVYELKAIERFPFRLTRLP